MNSNTYQVAFNVTVDQTQLPPAVDLASEITYRVRHMVRTTVAGLWGVTFDQQTVVVANENGTCHVLFEVTVEEGDGYWPAHTSMEREIARRTGNMVQQEIAWLPGYGIWFNPYSVNVTKVTDTSTPTTSTAPTSTMRPGVTPAPVAFSHAATEPVTAAPAKRGWRRLFGRG